MKEAGVIVSELEDFVIKFDEVDGDEIHDYDDVYQIFDELKKILGWKHG